MKKALLLFLMPLLALASSCSYDDSEVKDRLDNLDNKVAELEKLVKTLNSDVSALRDLVSNKRFISGVTTNPDGSTTLTLVTAGGEQTYIDIKNGTDGKSPELGVKQDTDGIYYWTLNGEYILAGGKKLPVTGNDGVTPEFKIDNNNWYISYDKGTTWTECGKATYDSSIFKSVTLSEDGKQVIMILADGTRMTFDLYTGFGIAFKITSEQTLRVGETLEIPFTLTGADDKTLIEVLPSSGWQAVVERDGNVGGVLKVTAPADGQTGKVIVLVNDGGTKTLMRTLTFVSGVLNITTSSTDVPTSGGPVTVQVETDLKYTVSIPQEAAGWITLPGTRGDIRHETVTLNIAANTDPAPRQAKIELVSGNTTIETILIYQLAHYDLETMVLKVEANAALSNIIYAPLYGAVNATINWGDGNSQTVEATINTAAGMITHTYAQPGNYYISIKGSAAQFNGNLIKNANKPGIVEVIQWGQLGLTSLANAFTGDTKLVKVALPEAGAFANVTTAESMFYGCTSLQDIPVALFTDGGNITSIAGMFSGCTALKSIPEQLFAPMGKITNASNLFYKCKNLESVPAGLFRNNTAIENIAMAFGDSGLKSVSEDLFKGLTSVTNMSSLFTNVAVLESLPANLFKDQAAVINLASAFNGCSSLQSIPESLLSKMTSLTNTAMMLKGCTSLTSLPEGLFAACGNAINITGMFSNCTSLENLPVGILRPFVKATSAGSLFEGCIKMTEFPDLKSCTALTSVPSIWKGCTSLVSAPADYFPESLQKSNSAAYIFSGCTALKNVPADLFKDFTGITIISEMFLNCTALESLPAGLFDKMTKIKTATKTFSGCTNLSSESPYTTITVGGEAVKVHLYERRNYPDQFVDIVDKSATDCFKGCTKIADYTNIPIPWGGLSDGTKAKPALNLTIGLTQGQEYYAVSSSFKGTEIKSDNKWTMMTPEGLEDALKELNGELKRVCTKYGMTYNIANANSEAGVVLAPITAEADTEYVFVVMASNAHGTTFAQKTIKTAPYPAGEANYDRYLGSWKVTSTSSEINKAPQTFTIEITPYRINESFRIRGWGINILSNDDEFRLPMAYANGNVTIQANDPIGLYYPHYVYPMCRFYKPETSSYWLWKPSTPLISGTYDTANNRITIKGEKFTTEGNEYTVSGLDYILYSGGQYRDYENLLKPGYTRADYSVGPYTLVKTTPAATPAKAAKSSKITPLQPGNAQQGVSAPTGAYKLTSK